VKGLERRGASEEIQPASLESEKVTQKRAQAGLSAKKPRILRCNTALEMQREEPMLQFWKSKPQEPPAPPFDIHREREMRRLAIVEADSALSEAVEVLKAFQGKHFATDSNGQLVPRVARTGVVVPNQALYMERLRLTQILSAAHDQFQKALRRYNEIA